MSFIQYIVKTANGTYGVKAIAYAVCVLKSL